MTGIKLIGLEFENFKSLKNANLDLKKDITGIYGENGIGKTSVIEAIELLQREFIYSSGDMKLSKSKESIDVNKLFLNLYKKYISNDECEMKLSYKFQKNNFVYTYQKRVKFIESEYKAHAETITYYNVNSKSKIHEVFKREVNGKNSKSLFNYNLFENEHEIKLEEISTEAFSGLSSIASQLPFFLSKDIELKSLTANKMQHVNNICEIVDYVLKSSIIKLNDQSLIDLGICIPVNVHHREDSTGAHGKIAIRQFNEFYDEKIINDIIATFKLVNQLLKPIASNREVVVEIVDTQVSENTDELKQAVRLDIKQPDGALVNIQNESTGIIKLISILSTFTELVTNDDYLLIIDELDSHVYEYLLSTLIKELNDNIKGRLIFTSHNLTLFEKLSPQNFAIIQKNEKLNINEFVYLKSSNRSVNLRSQYLRALQLGDENIYPIALNESKLFRAFRKIARGVKL